MSGDRSKDASEKTEPRPKSTPAGGAGEDVSQGEMEIIDAEIEDDDLEELIGEDDASSSESKKTIVPYRGPGSLAYSDPLTRYINEVKRFAELDKEAEWELARRYRDHGDRKAAADLVTANLMLVVKLALMYRRALRNVMDLIQEGNVGLMEALKRYDPEQGVRFSTYASWWIKAYILKFLLDNARLVRVGTTNARRKLLFNLRKEQRKLEAQGITPTHRLLADKLGVSEDDVVEVDKVLSSSDVSTDTPLTSESQTTIGEMLPAERESIEDAVVASDLRERIDAAVAGFRTGLSERDAAILDQRLMAEESLTLQELGDRFGVTREAMRQAESKLKKRLAVHLKNTLGDEIVLHFSK